MRPPRLMTLLAAALLLAPSAAPLPAQSNKVLDITEEILDRYFWRFMNHGCEPNTIIRGQDVVALRAIKPWEDVTFNYTSTDTSDFVPTVSVA